jgi:uncharacterized protein (DUF4415 family)
MTTGIEYLKPEKKRQGRGPSKKPTLVNTSLRLPREVVEYFETFPNKQAKIREVLVNYVETQTGEFENDNSN